MGTLVGKAYPTQMALGLADHTYVECGTGQVGWSCWGGKSGGREIVRGTGSTKQANAIATPNERAGITCYAINGVCHQAANRVLWPARILVNAATGYWVSSSLFGTYGRENRNLFHVCEAPIDPHNNLTGDMAACVSHAAEPPPALASSAADLLALKSFAEAAMNLHEQASALGAGDDAGHLNSQLEHFSLQSQFRLGPRYSKTLDAKLRRLRTNIEKERLKLEKAYAAKHIDIKQFAEDFNKLTVKFQDHMAETLKPEQFRSYFALERSARVILLDPHVIDKIHASA